MKTKPAHTKKWTKWRMKSAIRFYEEALENKPYCPFGKVALYKRTLHQLRFNLSHS